MLSLASRTFASIAFLLLTFLPGVSLALEIPTPGPYDERIKFVDYLAAEVVNLVGHYGYQTHIQFSPNEVIYKVAMGDEGAWTVVPVENHLFIKPKADQANTNMTVLTNRRAYSFVLSAHWSQNGAKPVPNDMYFSVNFRYPQDEAAAALAAAEAKELHDKLNQDHKPVPVNWNYWVKGSDDVTPSRAFDDGRFTYLTFPGNREMPAVFIENAAGEESLVNTHVDGDTIVVHKVARTLVLRKGQAVAGLVNRSYDPNGISNPTGTTTPNVKRVIRGAK